jgi:site-specific DNA-methyltransferase (adenine-specific)
MTFYKGDALETIKNKIKDKSIDLIYADPPFGTTGAWWDEKMDWPELFKEFFRVLKDNGMIVLHCSIPFNYELIRSAPKPPAYSWYWKKNNSTNHLSVNRMPMRNVEEILVWKNKKNKYNPQRIGTEERILPGKKAEHNIYWNGGVKEIEKRKVVGKSMTHFLDFSRSLDEFSTRPNEIIDLMINSYSNPGETILDISCFKGISGVRAKELGRNWIGIDKYHEPTLLQKTLPEPTFNLDLVEVKQSPIHCKGLFAKSNIPANTRICDYKGELLTLTEYCAKYNNTYNYCYIYRRQNKVLDGRSNLTENPSHYCNESKSPNVVLKGRGLVTMREIQAGEELFLKYPKDYSRDYELS